jgi:RNA polymerase sigma factor (TIGR02999 family)
MTPDPRRHEVTDALREVQDGVSGAMDRLMALVYKDLRRVAHRQLQAEPEGHTLCTTALVHECFLRLVDQTRARWKDRSQFFAVSAQAMRRILVDHARRFRAQRRGGRGKQIVPLETLNRSDPGFSLSAISVAERADAMVGLDEALDRLRKVNPRMVRVIEYRFFVGLTEKETASILGLSTRTVAREWVAAREWLHGELRRDVD